MAKIWGSTDLLRVVGEAEFREEDRKETAVQVEGKLNDKKVIS